MSVELMLECSFVSILIIEERKNSNIVVGVPHHAPKGVKHLRCKKENGQYRVSDENAGFLGRYVAEKISSNSIIACNYTLDVNKNLGTDYSVQIAKWKPSFLIEIHGHGDSNNNILISAGSKNDRHTRDLTDILNKKISKNKILSNLNIFGTFGELPKKYKATKSATIIDNRWKSIHIELPNGLRKNEDTDSIKPPNEGYLFCDCLVESIKELFL